MREAFDTLTSTLKDLKKTGTRSVLLAPDTLRLLTERAKMAIEEVRKLEMNETPSATIIPEKHPQQAVASAEPRSEKPVSAQPNTAQQGGKKAITPHPSAPTSVANNNPTLPAPPILDIPEGSKKQQLNWLKNRVLNCEVCLKQVKPGKKVVFGIGSPDASIFFCGEAPGAEEETQGEPFVGAAGDLLNRIIKAMGLGRNDVYIGNIMNWRPETSTEFGNRPPTPEEMAFCLPYLKAQIAIVQPKVIVALGATAVHGLLGHDPKRSITKSHGTWHQFEGIPTIITYHPSYVLRNGSNTVKRQIWEDMLATMEQVGLPISQRQRDFFR